MENLQTTYSKQYGMVIKLYDSPFPNGTVIQLLSWGGFTFEQFMRWQWYFRYREALLQVAYPKNSVERIQTVEELSEKNKQNLIKAKQTSLKAKITKYKNRYKSFLQEFENYKSNYSGLFPIEQEANYLMYTNSLSLAESKIEKA